MDIGDGDREDVAGLEESRKRVMAYIQREVDDGIPADRIVLGGMALSSRFINL